MIRSYKFTPQFDIMDKIKNNSVIEFYNTENVQIFRNLNFFKICSYSFDEILSRPWFELYKREDFITEQIYHAAISSFDPGSRTKKINIPTHYLEELESYLKNKMQIKVDYISPLSQNGNVAAIIVVEEAQLN